MALRSVITLANSIIGVSILAMPFCFKQCGIVLAILLLLLSGAVVKVCCHLLVKSAMLARRRNYELLAFQTFGPAGKLGVEISMIGFLMGTCIAFFVVMGDLAPPIIADFLGVESSMRLRLVILIGLGLFVALPLALLRNVDSLAGLCTASILFYLFVLLYIVVNSAPSLFDGSWRAVVNYWRPAGIFQCLPIFCMALSCQAQVFEIYDALPNPSPTAMNDVVKNAVNLCTASYICVGFFGYVTFSTIELGGNVLTAYQTSLFLQLIKLGFVISVAMSFPLVVFPCRTSIHSMLFRKGSAPTASESMVSNYIPPNRFNVITVAVLLITLAVAIMIPDIEFVLGMVGSTIGSAICIVFPTLMFVKLTSKQTTERLAAQFVFVVGVSMMIIGTYSNLQEANRSMESIMEEKNLHLKQIEETLGKNPPLGPINPIPTSSSTAAKIPLLPVVNRDSAKKKIEDKVNNVERREPAIPNPPDDSGPRREEVIEEPKAAVKESKEVNAAVAGSSSTTTSTTTKKLEDVKRVEKVLEKKAKKVAEKEKELEVKEQKADQLIQDLEKAKIEQKQIIEEQKEVLQQMKEVVGANEDSAGAQQQQQQAPPSPTPNRHLQQPSPRGPGLSEAGYEALPAAGSRNGTAGTANRLQQEDSRGVERVDSAPQRQDPLTNQRILINSEEMQQQQVPQQPVVVQQQQSRERQRPLRVHQSREQQQRQVVSEKKAVPSVAAVRQEDKATEDTGKKKRRRGGGGRKRKSQAGDRNAAAEEGEAVLPQDL